MTATGEKGTQKKRATGRRASGPRPPIEPRDLHFDLPAVHAGRWHSANPYISHFWNGLSIMFPDGERFFMDSVRRVRPGIDDGQLQEQIRAFLSQEGIHAREHRSYNDVLREQGYPARLLGWVTGLALWSTRVTSARWQLAITCAFEHFTAMLADAALRDPRLFEDAVPAYAALWRWHCVEETEHKAVAFDTYEAVAPGLVGYLRRVIAMSFVTANFLPYTLVLQLLLAAHDGVLLDLGAAGDALRYFWERPGLIRRGIGLYADYYRPGFHPWDNENKLLVDHWREALMTVTSTWSHDEAPR
jgi:predicted metal-dependent hydrolase